MVVKNREKRVTATGDGRQGDRCEGNWSVMGDESVGVEAVFPVFAVFLLHVQGWCKARSNLFACVVKRSKNAEPSSLELC